MVFTKVQFVALEIKTGFRRMDMKDLGQEFQFYYGESDQDLDIKHRFEAMSLAIKSSQELTVNEANVLKIFVAPEFFWQPSKGNYDVAHIKSLVDQLAKFAGDDKFQQWMFVFGTMIGDGSQLPGGDKLPGKIHNIVYVQQGGKGGSSFFSFKEHKSGIDFVLKEGTEENGITVRSPFLNGTQLTLDQLPNIVGNNAPAFFTMCGIDFGLEVCLDHAMKFLKGKIGGHPRPSVHLITSCGMCVKNEAVIARPGGLVLLCDGASTFSSLGIVKGNYSKAGSAPLQLIATWNMATDKMVMNTGLRGVPLKVSSKCFRVEEFQPRVVIYTKQDLPGGDIAWA